MGEPIPRSVWVERIAENFIVVVCIYVVDQGILFSVSSTGLVCVVFFCIGCRIVYITCCFFFPLLFT